MTNLTVDHLRDLLDKHFQGTLADGGHCYVDGETTPKRCCAHELVRFARDPGCSWLEDVRPQDQGLPDLRYLNDSLNWDAAQRTEYLVPVLVALDGWAGWPAVRRHDFTERVRARLPWLGDARIDHFGSQADDEAERLQSSKPLIDLCKAMVGEAGK